MKRTHIVVQHRSTLPGIEAMTMLTDREFPRHSHDQFGIGIMTSGAQRSWSVMGEVLAKAGDVIMVNPGEMHDGVPMGGARGWQIMYIDPTVVFREVASEALGSELVFRPVAQDPFLAAHVVRLFKQMEAANPDPIIAEESLLCCLMSISEKHGIDGPHAICGSPSVLKAVQRLEAAPEMSVSLSELSALSGVSRFQLLRGFFREIGTTPHAYLIQLRVRLVRRYLAAGKSPAEAALLAGFADQSHMTRAFAKQFGITPARYKAGIT